MSTTDFVPGAPAQSRGIVWEPSSQVFGSVFEEGGLTRFTRYDQAGAMLGSEVLPAATGLGYNARIVTAGGELIVGTGEGAGANWWLHRMSPGGGRIVPAVRAARACLTRRTSKTASCSSRRRRRCS